MTQAKHLEEFLSAVRGIHATGGGTKETSFYTALNNLLDGIGHILKPKVRCVMQLKNLGAGNPDDGLFTADQFDRQTGEAKDLGKPIRENWPRIPVPGVTSGTIRDELKPIAVVSRSEGNSNLVVW